MIKIEHLYKTYHADDPERRHEALKDINLTIDDGEVYGIIGESGAGKSTLVRTINLLERPTQGSIVIDGNDITGYKGKQLLDLRKNIGMIFQHFSLFAQRTVLGNVMFPMEVRGQKKDAAQKRALELLDMVGLADRADN